MSRINSFFSCYRLSKPGPGDGERNRFFGAHLRPAGPTMGAEPTTGVVVEHYASADLGLRRAHARAGFDDYSTRFMAGNDRR